MDLLPTGPTAPDINNPPPATPPAAPASAVPLPDLPAPAPAATPAPPPAPPPAGPVLVEVEGQQFTVDAAIAADPAQLLGLLRPFFPQVATAQVVPGTDPATGRPKLTLVKNAGQKGAPAPADARAFADALVAAPAALHPALAAVWRLAETERTNGPFDLLTLLRLAPAIDAAEEAGHAEAAYGDNSTRALLAAPAVPTPGVPLGF